MPTNRTQLNPRNPLHWLMLLYWFVVAPAQLRRYHQSAGDDEREAISETALWSVITISLLPLLLVISANIFYLEGYGSDLFYYLPSGFGLLYVLCASITSLIKGKADMTWVVGLATFVANTLLASVVFLASFVVETLIFGSGVSFENGSSAMAFYAYQAISLVVIVLYLCASGVGAGLAGALNIEAKSSPHSDAWLGSSLLIGLLFGLLYGLIMGMIATIGSDLSGLAFGYYAVSAESPIVQVLIILVCVTVVAVNYSQRSRNLAFAVGFALMTAFLVASIATSVIAAIKTVGPQVGLQEGIFLAMVGSFATIPMALVLAVGYGLAFGFAFWMVRRVANSLVRRYQRIGDDKADEASAAV